MLLLLTHVVVNRTSLRAFLYLPSTPDIRSGSFKQQLAEKRLHLNVIIISNSPETDTLSLPFQVEAGS